jgi:hypothetical protein
MILVCVIVSVKCVVGNRRVPYNGYTFIFWRKTFVKGLKVVCACRSFVKCEQGTDHSDCKYCLVSSSGWAIRFVIICKCTCRYFSTYLRLSIFCSGTDAI